MKTFYLQFQFRHSFVMFQQDPQLQGSLLNATAFVLGLALSDVRAYKLRPATDKNGIELDAPQLITEIVSPFLQKDEADQVLIDTWFGAFEIPVDTVTSYTWDEMHPPLPPLPEDPFLPTWAWGLISSAASGILLTLPVYCCYFRRLANTRKRYVSQSGVDPSFIEKVVANSDAGLVRRFVARDDGAKEFKDS